MLVGVGRATLADLLGLVDLCARMARENGYPRALVDLLSADADLSPAEYERLDAYATQELRHLARIGFVVSDGYRRGTADRMARAWGMESRSFGDMRQATEWISFGSRHSGLGDLG
jgi:hypothetical protein